MLDAERAYFERNQSELEAHHYGRIVLIKDEELIGAFNTIQEALAEGTKRFGLTPFLVRQVGLPVNAVSIPALTLGILHADPTRTNTGTSATR